MAVGTMAIAHMPPCTRAKPAGIRAPPAMRLHFQHGCRITTSRSLRTAAHIQEVLAGRLDGKLTKSSIMALKVAELREIAAEAGLPTSGTKPILVNTLIEALHQAPARPDKTPAELNTLGDGGGAAVDTSHTSGGAAPTRRSNDAKEREREQARTGIGRAEVPGGEGHEHATGDSNAAATVDQQSAVVTQQLDDSDSDQAAGAAPQGGSAWLSLGASEFLYKRRTWEHRTRQAVTGNPTGLSVTWLGTSSGAPSFSRNISCIALRCGEPETLMIVDCGEGTQYQFDAFGLNPASVSHIFITHHHGDHCFGLPSFINARNHAFNKKGVAPAPLAIYGPPGVANIVISSISLTAYASIGAPRAAPIAITEWCLAAADAQRPTKVEHPHLNITVGRRPPDQAHPSHTEPVDVRRIATARTPGSGRRTDPVVPIYSGLTWSVLGSNGLRVQSAQLHHRVPCWGYVFQEPPTLSDGRKGGRKVCLLGDTYNSAAIERVAMGAHVVSHEATFLHAMLDKARIATHSTGVMAGAFARKIRAQQLILTHFSGRYGHGGDMPSPDAEEDFQNDVQVQSDVAWLQSEAAKAAHPVPVDCAFDGYTYRVPAL